MPYKVRQATAADHAVIVEFNSRLAQESEGKALDPVEVDRGVAAVLADAHKGVYFLAEDEGTVIGQVCITFEFSDWRNGWFWWIQSVYVPAAWRRQGVFRALLKYVHEAARKDPEVIGLRLYVDRDNEIAHQTYLSLGWVWTSYLLMEKYPLA